MRHNVSAGLNVTVILIPVAVTSMLHRHRHFKQAGGNTVVLPPACLKSKAARQVARAVYTQPPARSLLQDKMHWCFFFWAKDTIV